jgi:hypothetical protein
MLQQLFRHHHHTFRLPSPSIVALTLLFGGTHTKQTQTEPTTKWEAEGT